MLALEFDIAKRSSALAATYFKLAIVHVRTQHLDLLTVSLLVLSRIRVSTFFFPNKYSSISSLLRFIPPELGAAYIQSKRSDRFLQFQIRFLMYTCIKESTINTFVPHLPVIVGVLGAAALP